MSETKEYSPGTYWKRRKVEPCLMRNPREKLHTNLEVGTFVMIIARFFPLKDEVNYALVENTSKREIMSEKRFAIYFEKVELESELGLIKLAEM